VPTRAPSPVTPRGDGAGARAPAGAAAGLYEAVARRVREIEVKHDLLRYEVGGWCAWVVLRFAVSLALSKEAIASAEAMGVRERLVNAGRDLAGLLTVRRARYVVNTYVSGLLEQEDGSYKDIWVDDFLHSLPRSSFVKIDTLNRPTFRERRRAAWVKSDLTTTVFELAAGALSRLGGPRHVRLAARQISERVEAELEPGVLGARRALLRLRRFHWLKVLYRWLLARIRPAYLIIEDPSEHALIAAAKECGVTVVELQHGFVDGRYHMSYAWTPDARRYRPRMPIADRLLLYGEHWRRELEGGGFWSGALRVVGSVRMDQYRRRRAGRAADGRTIVWTTQGLDVEATVAFMQGLLAELEAERDVRLWVKLHPAAETDKRPYAGLATDPRVRVWLGTEEPSTYALLSRAALHVSISSTCHYEALGLGVPTVIVPFTSHELALPLYAAGHASLARTPRELADVLRGLGAHAVPPEVGAYYFSEGALEAMRRELVRDGRSGE
jgi:hypothetical protein